MATNHIVLISCVKTKKNRRAPAGELYISQWFCKALAYAQKQQPTAIYVLSAMFGLLPLEQHVEPYDLTLNRMNRADRLAWAQRVLAELRSRHDLTRDKFTLLAGVPYRELLIPALKNVCIPMRGLSQGNQIQFLTNAMKQPDSIAPTPAPRNVCDQLHQAVHALTRFRFPIDRRSIPANGIYFLFEQHEPGHGRDRIVRIGTHRGQNQLFGRLNEHFSKPNKDRSIFRKNIGRALLAKRNDPFLEHWQRDLMTPANRAKFSHAIDPQKQQEVEAQVSKIIVERFSFAVLPVEDAVERQRLEAHLIATVAQCPDCPASPDWLGHASPEPRIRTSSLWQVQHLTAAPLDHLPPQFHTKPPPPSPDDACAMVRKRKQANAWLIEALTVAWPHPHTPVETWRTVLQFPADTKDEPLRQALALVAMDSRFFLTCIACHTRHPRGQMHDQTTCHACAEKHGIVY